MRPFIRTPYNYDPDRASHVSGLTCLEPSRTKQEFATDADINVIAERFGLYGRLPESGLAAPVYADFEGVGDFHQALNVVRAAAGAFMQLPAKVRARFSHDPQEFVQFCSDPANAEELKAMGLTERVSVHQGTPVPAQSAALLAAPPGALPSGN